MSDFISYKYSVRPAILVSPPYLEVRWKIGLYVTSYIYMNFDTEINLLLTLVKKEQIVQ